MTTIAFPEALPRIIAAHEANRLRSGSWGGTEAVCMMSAFEPTAADGREGACVTAGWPEWLVDLNVTLFDAKVGADDEDLARFEFARDVAKAVAVPRNMEKARDLFLVATLERVEAHDRTGVVRPVIDLLHRRLAGEGVAKEMAAARVAADAAADAAAYAAAYAAARAAARADLIAALNAA